MLFLNLFIVSFIAIANVSSFKFQRATNQFWLTKKGLFAAAAVETNQRIEPVTYCKDLYGVLGVSPRASKSEIKNAYIKIVAKSHPDRDDSVEALSIFRNATYAYKILAKDEKAKSHYDLRYNTDRYFSVIEKIGDGIMKPIVEDIVVPLLRQSLKSVGTSAAWVIIQALGDKSNKKLLG